MTFGKMGTNPLKGCDVPDTSNSLRSLRTAAEERPLGLQPMDEEPLLLRRALPETAGD